MHADLSAPPRPPAREGLRLLAAFGLALGLWLLPPPAGLAPHAWCFFAIFTGVVVALILEPVPNAAAGLVGIAAIAALGRWTLFTPAELAQPGFDPATRAIGWALSGFANASVWLVFAAFMFGLGYEKTGLGRRIALLLVAKMGASTLRLGYAITLFDAILAPFTPSNTARSAGTVYPIVRQLPPLYESHPFDPSARRIGAYLMWTAFAASCVTSALFLTALAPNLIAAELIERTLGVQVTWTGWLRAAAPFGVPLLLGLPLLVYALYRPGLRTSPAVPAWAAGELARLGPPSRRELTMAVLALAALGLWILAGDLINATTVAFAVIVLMILARVIAWSELIGHAQAWDALLRLGTLVTLAEGLRRTGFIDWLAHGVAGEFAGFGPTPMAVLLTVFYFIAHYLFATTTAHAVAVFPVMIAIGAATPGLDAFGFAMLLALTHGLMGVISPYATGPSPVFHGSGYITNRAYWRLGATFGAIFLASVLAFGAPFLLK